MIAVSAALAWHACCLAGSHARNDNKCLASSSVQSSLARHRESHRARGLFARSASPGSAAGPPTLQPSPSDPPTLRPNDNLCFDSMGGLASEGMWHAHTTPRSPRPEDCRNSNHNVCCVRNTNAVIYIYIYYQLNIYIYIYTDIHINI